MPRPKKEQPNHGDLYEVKVTTGHRMNGELVRKSFYSAISKEDARRSANEWLAERRAHDLIGEQFIAEDKRFNDWAAYWLRVYKKPNVSPGTYRCTYEQVLRLHILPYFGQARLSDIRPADVKDFYNTKKDSSPSTLAKLRLNLNALFNAAVANDLCRHNPAEGVPLPTGAPLHEKRVYTDAEMVTVRAEAVKTAPIVIVLLDTGIRLGELCGLRVGDLDTTAHTLRVARSITKQGKQLVARPPKWDSYRTNPITIEAETILSSMIPSGTDADTYILTGTRDPIGTNAVAKRLQYWMRAHLPVELHRTAHELRHTCGTVLRRRGVDIYTIQKFMGHKSIDVTANTYVHNELDAMRAALRYDKPRPKYTVKRRTKPSHSTKTSPSLYDTSTT